MMSKRSKAQGGAAEVPPQTDGTEVPRHGI